MGGDSSERFISFILTEKLKALKPFLRSWNKEVFGQIDSKKQSA